MGMLEEKSDGTYQLEVKIGCITVKKAFKEMPLENSETKPKQDGFYLNIPDIQNG